MQGSVADLAQIRQAIAIFFLAGMLVELRVPKAGRFKTLSGYYDDFEKLAQAAREADGKGPGVYWTLNPVEPALLARAANRTRAYADDTTKDEQIVERRWFLVDCDPKRPSGISTTDAEHDAALDRAANIRERLAAEGWPDPITVDSGNGAHLLYRVELPNDEGSKLLLQCVLKALARRHDDAVVEVDQTTFNAARICKVPGTTARKGDSLPDRPHRLSRLLRAPEVIKPVPLASLKALAAEVPDAHSKATSEPKAALSRNTVSQPIPGEPINALGDRFDVERWMQQVGIDVGRGPVPFNGGRKWDVRCPFNPDHTNAALFEGADGKLGYHCFHNSCRDQHWHAFREHYEPGYRVRRAVESARLTDVGNAKRLVARHGENLRYCYAWRQWLYWDGVRWRVDSGAIIERLAKETVAATLAEAGDDEKRAKHATKSEHEQRIKASIALARSEPGIAVQPGELDCHPFLLNVANGTLDLRSGELRAHDKRDMLTKVVPVRYEPNATARRFQRFIIQVLGGKRALVRYVQRAIGYSLTGSCKEQVLFILFGSGSNGKSTLLNVIHEMLGPDFAVDTPADTFTAKPYGDGIPNDLARLKGARFVTAVELEGRKLDEPKLKRITGQDAITARFLRAEFFQFTAEFKLWIACNRKPAIEGSGPAMWRRIRLIPFLVHFDQPDRGLMDKLRRELPGILAWCVRGCIAWRRFGLGLPEPVGMATEAYRHEMDAVGRFLAECCTQNDAGKTAAMHLYAAYSRWCGHAEERLLSQVAFGRNLRDRGLSKSRGGDNGAYVYRGLTLLPDALNKLNDLNDPPDSPLKKDLSECNGKSVQTEQQPFSAPSGPKSSPKGWLV